jgi:hypothetical protein
MLGSIARATSVIALLAVAAAPASAKTCKDPLSTKSSSRIAGDDEKRDARAKDNSIKAQATHGIAYRFWFRAEDKQVDCGRGKSSSHCTVTAKPCTAW